MEDIVRIRKIGDWQVVKFHAAFDFTTTCTVWRDG